MSATYSLSAVAPVRERGLKLNLATLPLSKRCRSREGAWIEIVQNAELKKQRLVAPVRERGLKYDYGGNISDLTSSRSREGAWIEIKVMTLTSR